MMSSIPNSAMPHAGPSTNESETASESGSGTSLSERAGKIADLARDNPKTAIAAGAAVVAGAVAAAAIPIVRSRRKSSEGEGSSGAGKSDSSNKKSS